MAPQIDVFTTTILSNPGIRSRHERLHRHLQAARIEYTTHDVASDEEAKKFWKRKNGGNNELPCILVNGERAGTFEEFEESVEFNELPIFLKLSSSSSSGAPPAPSASSNTLDDDLASLSLTPSELAELESSLDNSTASHLPKQSQFSQTHSILPSLAPIQPLSFKRHSSWTEDPALRQNRPISQDAAKDELEGIDLTEEEAEMVLKELEKELGVAVPPPPPSSEPSTTEKAVEFSTASASEAAAQVTSLAGAGGAQLSAPLAAISKLPPVLDDASTARRTLDHPETLKEELKKHDLLPSTRTLVVENAPTAEGTRESSPLPSPLPTPGELEKPSQQESQVEAAKEVRELKREIQLENDRKTGEVKGPGTDLADVDRNVAQAVKDGFL